MMKDTLAHRLTTHLVDAFSPMLMHGAWQGPTTSSPEGLAWSRRSEQGCEQQIAVQLDTRWTQAGGSCTVNLGHRDPCFDAFIGSPPQQLLHVRLGRLVTGKDT